MLALQIEHSASIVPTPRWNALHAGSVMTPSWIDSCVEGGSWTCSATESGPENWFCPWSEQPGKELGRPLHRPAPIFLPVSKNDLRTFGGGRQSVAAIPVCAVVPRGAVLQSRHRLDHGCCRHKPFSVFPAWPFHGFPYRS